MDEIRIYLSASTGELTAERALLAESVLPRLREQAARAGREIACELIDPETRSAGWSLKDRLRAIDACQLFVAFVGERVGAPLPPPQADLLRQYPWLSDLGGASLAEAEIVYGALVDRSARQSFLYLRAEDFPFPARERVRFLAATREEADRLAQLKDSLRASGRPVLDGYGCHWDATARRVVGLEALGDRLVDDLWAAVRDEPEASARRPAGPPARPAEPSPALFAVPPRPAAPPPFRPAPPVAPPPVPPLVPAVPPNTPPPLDGPDLDDTAVAAAAADLTTPKPTAPPASVEAIHPADPAPDEASPSGAGERAEERSEERSEEKRGEAAGAAPTTPSPASDDHPASAEATAGAPGELEIEAREIPPQPWVAPTGWPRPAGDGQPGRPDGQLEPSSADGELEPFASRAADTALPAAPNPLVSSLPPLRSAAVPRRSSPGAWLAVALLILALAALVLWFLLRH